MRAFVSKFRICVVTERQGFGSLDLAFVLLRNDGGGEAECVKRIRLASWFGAAVSF